MAIGTIAATCVRRTTWRGKLATCLLPLGALLPLSTHAVTATGLSSFEGIEESLVRYSPGAGTFVHDDFVNTADLGGGVFRMLLRYRPDEWDGDRDTPNKDRQRAEVKGLGVHQKTGETFDYSTTWRTNPGLRGASRFCHIFQLKSTDGDSGMPVVTISILEGQQRAAVRYCSGRSKDEIIAREFAWTPGKWQTVRVRIRTSMTEDGEVLASIDGDPFEGARGLAVYRPDATDYRPKWGLYRGTSPGLLLGDDYVEHKDISAERTGVVSDPEQIRMENAARKLALNSPMEALAWLQSQPPSPARAVAIATIAAEWSQTEPAAAMSFVEKLAPAEVGRAAAMQRVFNRWADQDADAVLRWVAARAPAAELDPLLWYFATDSTFRYVAREKALAGAVLIGDSELRASALDHVVLIWARREPTEAARYIEECPALTPEQKAEIRLKIDAGRK
jgi:hypothetical protein